MKLRIKDQTVRLRLSQSEVTELRNQGTLQCHTDFPGSRRLTYGISLAPDDNWDAGFDEQGIQIKVPATLLYTWADTDQVTIQNSHAFEGSAVDLLIEKDFKCLTARPSEDEGDLFPNPLKSH